MITGLPQIVFEGELALLVVCGAWLLQSWCFRCKWV